jgi:hypothetical protein
MAVMAQEAPPTDRDQYGGRSMKVFDVPGISVAIVRDGKSLSLAGMALSHGSPELVRIAQALDLSIRTAEIAVISRARLVLVMF